jgi:hypothetical protein
MENCYIINLNESQKSYTLLIVNPSGMGLISRGPESQHPAPNKLSGPAWFDESGEIQSKFNEYDGDDDLDFDRQLEQLRSFPKFEDHREEIQKFWKENLEEDID